MRTTLVLICFIVLSIPFRAAAVTRTIEFSATTDGTPRLAMGSFGIDYDLVRYDEETNRGLSVNRLNFDVDGDVGYRIISETSDLIIGGLINSLGGIGGGNDFFLSISHSGRPRFSISQAGQGVLDSGYTQSCTIDGGPCPIPLPPAGLLLTGALGALALIGRARSRAKA